MRKNREQRANDKRNHPSGAKAHADFAGLAARLKSCPVTKQSICVGQRNFSASCKGHADFAAFAARLKVVPFQNADLIGFAARLKPCPFKTPT
jgi:hypothetical protein